MSLYELNKIVGRAAKAIYDNEKFPVGVLAVRARKAAEAHPTDPTVVAMSNFLSKRANTEVFITRAEFKSVYHKLFSQNNKFGSFFAEELGVTDLPKSHVMQRDPGEGKDFTKEAYEKLSDPVLSNALSSVLNKEASFKHYSASVAKSAARSCLHELNKYAAPRKIDVVAGQPDLLICQATYETPKGVTSVLLPVEVRDGMALLPTVFLSQAGFVDLTKETLADHILSTAGKKYAVDVQKVLEVVSNAKNGTPEPLSEMEVIIAKARFAKGSTHTANGILYQEVDQARPNIETPRHPEADTFEARLASTRGVAEFKFGKAAVDSSRQLLKQALGNFGYNANIGVADADDGTIFFAVSVDNRAAFKAPVKVSGQRIDIPKFVVSAGSIYDFSKQGISQILAANDVDGKMMAVASPAYALKPSELVEQVRVSVAEGNLDRADDALAVLQQSNDQVSFKLAFDIYKAGLGGKKIATASVENECTCSMQRKVAHSKYVICGHTNLPVHKVYQDKNGDCQPLYRRNIPEAESASFMHSKIYFG